MIKKYKLEKNSYFEMANIVPEDTGLPMVVWVSEKRGNHGPRIKVSSKYGNKINNNLTFLIIISNDLKIIGDTGNIKNKDIELVKTWILLNKDLLLQYWNMQISTKEFLNNIKVI